MGLVYCPECGTKISDKASVCPFCGFRSSAKNLPMVANKNPLKRIQWESTSLASEFDQVFPISTIQNNNLNIIFGQAENLSRVAPAFFQSIMAILPKTIKVAEVNPALQKLIDEGVFKFLTDKSGDILPTIFGEKHIVAQVRLKDIQLTPDLGRSIVDLQTQIALAQVINEIHDVQRSIANLHSELQDDRLALAESAWQQLQQAAQIIDARVRQEKLLSILSSATDAKCILFRAFASEKRFFDERKDKNWFSNLIDKESQNRGDEHSAEIFNSLLAITKTVQVESTVYCLLGEQNAARLSMKQFSDFISANSLDDRDTLLALNSFSSSDQRGLIDNFTDIQQKIAALPPDIEGTKPLIDILPAKKEKNDE
ncbi:MAG: zinc ribbon domain-containing protein [Anaerolineaceae bacterium]|nr:zinc ribbon domain-containing protein [Anaerolineaceae bacterium]